MGAAGKSRPFSPQEGEGAMSWQARAAGIAALLSAAAVVVITEPAHAAVPVTLQADQAVYLVDQGGTAHVGIRLTTTGNVATDADVTVSYSTGGTLSIRSGTN